jgi:hypothetical protein
MMISLNQESATESRFTLWFESADPALDDQILACGMTLAEAAECVRGFIPADYRVLDRDHGSFRSFDLMRNDSTSGETMVLGATVPKTGDYAADRKLACEIIDVQTIDRDFLFWDGRVSGDAAFLRRVAENKKKQADAEREREIVTKVVDRLIGTGHCLVVDFHVRDRRKFELQLETVAKSGFDVDCRDEDAIYGSKKPTSPVQPVGLMMTVTTTDGRMMRQIRADCRALPLASRFNHGSTRAAFLAAIFENAVTPLCAVKNGETYSVEFQFGESGSDVVYDYDEELKEIVDPILRQHRPLTWVPDKLSDT